MRIENRRPAESIHRFICPCLMPVVQVCDGQSWWRAIVALPAADAGPYRGACKIVAVPFILTQTGYADGRLRVTSL